MERTHINVFGPSWHRETQSWRVYGHEHGPWPCRQIRYVWSGPYETEREAFEAMLGERCVFTERPE